MESIFEKSLAHVKYSINDSWHYYTYDQDAHTKERPGPDGEIVVVRLHKALCGLSSWQAPLPALFTSGMHSLPCTVLCYS